MKPIEFAVRRVTFVFADGSQVTDDMPCAFVPLGDVPEADHDAVVCAVGKKLMDVLLPQSNYNEARGSD